jgi:hypothetical protein
MWTKLSVPAEYAILKVFTPANRLVARWTLGPLVGGGSQRILDMSGLAPFANGLYYLVLEAPNGRVYGKWVVLH